MTDYAVLLEHPDAHAKIEREVMGNLRELASYETPKKFLLLPEDFTVESGEMTPTLKVKRRVVQKKYAKEIEELYKQDA